MFNLRRTLLFALLLIPVFTIGGIAQSPKGLAARRAQLRDALEQEWQYTLRTSPELGDVDRRSSLQRPMGRLLRG